MSEPASEPSKEIRESEYVCPLCAMLEGLGRWRSRSPVAQHFKTAQIEVLKGFRSLIDERIASIEKGARKTAEHATKINVE